MHPISNDLRSRRRYIFIDFLSTDNIDSEKSLSSTNFDV